MRIRRDSCERSHLEIQSATMYDKLMLLEQNGGVPDDELKKMSYNQSQMDSEDEEDVVVMNGNHEKNSHSKGWKIRASPAVLRSINPLRRIMESMPALEGRGKAPISLALGDPCAFGEMRAPQVAVDALIDAASGFKNNGYAPSAGIPECRRAVARYLSRDLPDEISADDIFMTPGCSQAIKFCIGALAANDEDGRCNMLVPRPGFPVYETFCHFFGVECRHYELLPEMEWQVDLASLEARADSKTAAILICNPGNPCGSVYSYQHLKQIARVARKLKLPIISDEIYAKMAFGERQFVSAAAFAWEVPVLALGGISKRWFVPGWRLGWVCVCDPHGILRQARVVEALTNLAHMHLATATLVQAALPTILQSTPPKFFSQTLKALSKAADLCYRRAKQIHGLSCPSKPRGSMYIMVRLDFCKFRNINDDREFAQALIKEEALAVLPGTAFAYPGWIRLLFAAPEAILDEAWNRIEAFCKRHAA